MKKNENIFISVQIQKDSESKKLMLSVQFDKNAPNISTESETIIWYPTCDEIDFTTEVFELLAGVRFPETLIEKSQNTPTLSKESTIDSSQQSSKIQTSLLEDDMTVGVSEGLRQSHLNNKENNEEILFQTDEKKIDEILNRNKSISKEDCVIQSNQKIRIDQMLRQKKKK